MPALLRLMLSRLAAAGLTLALLSVVIFALTEVLPGDVATRRLGRAPDPEQLRLLQARLGLDRPLWERYFAWAGGVLNLDLGVSLVSGRPVIQALGQRLANSALLGALALLLYVPIALVPALIQATRADRPADHAISIVSLAVLSLPDFLLATLLLLAFSHALGWVPARSTIDGAMATGEVLRALVLPAVTVAIVMGTYALRCLRDSLIQVLASEPIRMARLNGMPERQVLWRHALPAALTPAMTITALNLTYLFGGVVVVEQVFAFPGFGALLVEALLKLDLPVIQATVLVAGLAYVLGNLATDLAAVWLNPRLRGHP